MPVCLDNECIIKKQNACLKINKCGHQCFGFKNEVKCPLCLECEKVYNLNRLIMIIVIFVVLKVLDKLQLFKVLVVISFIIIVFKKI